MTTSAQESGRLYYQQISKRIKSSSPSHHPINVVPSAEEAMSTSIKTLTATQRNLICPTATSSVITPGVGALLRPIDVSGNIVRLFVVFSPPDYLGVVCWFLCDSMVYIISDALSGDRQRMASTLTNMEDRPLVSLETTTTLLSSRDE